MIFIFLLFLILTSGSTSAEVNSHILVIAPPILSHIIPSLELAKRLSTYCHVTYLLSAYKVEELQRKGLITAFDNSDTLEIVGLNDGNNYTIEWQFQDYDINLSNMTEISPDDTQKSAFNAVINRMSSALQQWFHSKTSVCSSSSSCQSLTPQPITRPINMIITRSFAPLSIVNLTVPFYFFLPSNLRGVIGILRRKKSNESGEEDPIDHLRKNINRADGFICNSLKEFDEKYLNDFYQLSGKQAPVHFVGPLIFHSQKVAESKTKEIINWLDAQPVASVIYIAFGSIVRLPPSAIAMLAKALSPYSFIWSLKTNVPLPSSLMNLDSHHQLILEWTPQRAILAHPSVSFFFSHGGRNSLLEGMLFGKAILVWPFFADQFNNAQQVIDMGMGRQASEHLQMDIELMLTNHSYTDKAKQIQEMVIQARESNSKEQIANIVRFASSKDKHSDEL